MIPARICPAANPATCLLDLFTGSRKAAPPPPAPRGVACEEECRLEEEYKRLQLEQWRLHQLNEQLRNDMFFKESAPSKSQSQMVDLLARMPPVEVDTYSEESSDFGNDQPKLEKRLSLAAENIESALDELHRPQNTHSVFGGKSLNMMYSSIAGQMNGIAMKGSALAMTRPAQAIIYILALSFVIFVLLAYAFGLGAHHDDCGSSSSSGHRRLSSSSCSSVASAVSHASGLVSSIASHASTAASTAASSAASTAASVHSTLIATTTELLEDSLADEHAGHRRLGGDVSPLMKNIAFTMSAAGLSTLFVNMARMPLILGYLIGGIVVGPICLGIVESHLAIAELSSLGLVFLLFMIGLELDMKALFKMGKAAIATGMMQFPISASLTTALFCAMTAGGFEFGKAGQFSAFYCGVGAGLSSPLIVVKLLGGKGEIDTVAGRWTMGTLICQDIWGMVVLALQANLSDFTFPNVIKTLGLLVVLILITLGYAKFLMPAVLHHASKSVELMLVLSLAWCFFVCCIAILPFVRLPMELAALVAGTALGTFPYSTDFNAKIKYIRDFFLCLFFAGMGMMLPVPSFTDILLGLFIALCLWIVRIASVFMPIWVMTADARVATVTTVNLAQLGESALVFCTLGVSHGHIGENTLETMLFTFVFTAIVSPLTIRNSHHIYTKIRFCVESYRGKEGEEEWTGSGELRCKTMEDKDIVLLGFHKIAFMLTAEFQARSPELLGAFHVIDFNKKVLAKLDDLGIKTTCGDISSPQLLAKAQLKAPRIVISTIPDTLLQGIDNAGLVRAVHQVWPSAHVIVTADSPGQAQALYDAGADYVLRMAKLTAERLQELLNEHNLDSEHSSLTDLFTQYKDRDNNIQATWLAQAQKW